MCLSAIIWANIETVWFGCEPGEAEEIGFRDDFIYRFIETKRKESSILGLWQMDHDACKHLYEEYASLGKKVY